MRLHTCHCCGCAFESAFIAATLSPLFCRDCRSHVIDEEGLSAQQRTYEALNSAPCPFRQREVASA